MTATDVRGCGSQRGYTENFRGNKGVIRLLTKVKLEIAVNENYVKAAVDAILKAAHSGRIGDGKIFVLRSTNVIASAPEKAAPWRSVHKTAPDDAAPRYTGSVPFRIPSKREIVVAKHNLPASPAVDLAQLPTPAIAAKVNVLVVSSVALAFMSFWRAAAIVLCDLASTAYYIGGISEQAVGKRRRGLSWP